MGDDRPERLIFASTHVLKASRELSAGHKLVWLEDHALHRGPDGAYIGAGPLGERLGLSRDQVERHRRDLLDLGLHVKRSRPGGRVSWYAVLPDTCIPSERPTAAEVRRLADRLDQHIRARRGGTDAATRSPTGLDHVASGALAVVRGPHGPVSWRRMRRAVAGGVMQVCARVAQPVAARRRVTGLAMARPGRSSLSGTAPDTVARNPAP